MFTSLFSALALAAVSVSAFKQPNNHAHLARLAKEDNDLFARAPGDVITSCVKDKTVALTFDDGPHWFTYDVSKTLIANNAKGTFFFNGNNVGGCIYNEDQAKRVKYVVEKGHMIASHTWAHQNLTTLNWDQIHHQMWLTEEALHKITGKYPAFMRPPYGSWNGLVRDAARARGQALALWDFDSLDWQVVTAAEILQRYRDVVKTNPKNLLTLNHEIHQHAAQVALPEIIKILKGAGYKLVTLAECLGQPAYQREDAPKGRDASWTCVGK